MSALDRLRSVKKQANEDIDAKKLYAWFVSTQVTENEWTPADVAEYKELVRAEMKSEEGKQKAITCWSAMYKAHLKNNSSLRDEA